MRAWQIITLLLLATAIFGPAAYFIYKITYEPVLREQLLREEEARQAALPPPPDPDIPLIQAAAKQKAAGDLEGAKTSLEAFLEQRPKSAVLGEAKTLLGEINATIYLSSRPSPDKIEYVVKSGDSLLRVQNQTKAPVELIMRANNLTSIRLQIGQKLYIPKSEFTIRISLGSKMIELSNSGKFFKQYPFEPLALPPANPKGTKTKVVEKSAWWQGERITFEDTNYLSSSRWIALADGTTLFSPSPEAWNLPEPRRGYKMSQPDVAEIQALLKAGTPVSITE